MHGQKGEEGERKVEALVRLAVKPLAYAGTAVLFVGLVYLGIVLREGSRGGEIRKAIAMIAAGAVVLGFASTYGFTGF